MLKNKGFTLIELLIVIAIIAILAGIALTNY
ncbi:MAG TPA: prepilin-type N-terminal cleavage/methylation domain-containing protein, partial [Candidatus Desulfofervidus auxilii]|nr:prepilin-type N-terminal cleavage/methylation domain-containing protein [Candidatus Desulfofervidus auxilii]